MAKTTGLPSSKDVLAAIGTVALRHGQLENALRRLLGEIAGLDENEALDATAFTNVSELRRRIRRFAKIKLGDGPTLMRLEALLERARRASDARNDLLHSTWGAENGKVVVRNAKHEFVEMPSLQSMERTAEQLRAIMSEVTTARLKDGFIQTALQKTAKPPEDEDEMPPDIR